MENQIWKKALADTLGVRQLAESWFVLRQERRRDRSTVTPPSPTNERSSGQLVDTGEQHYPACAVFPPSITSAAPVM